MQLEFSGQIFEKNSNIKLFRLARQMDGHDKANSRFSQFCERA